jgi:nicotinate phosphoribosyltransferase
VTTQEAAPETLPARARLDPGIFELPVADLRVGYRSAVYFNRARQIVHQRNAGQIVTMQVFHRQEEAVVCGVDEAIAILKVAAGEFVPDTTMGSPDAIFRLIVAARQQLRRSRPGIYRAGKHIELGNQYENTLRAIAQHERRLEEHWSSGWEQLDVRAHRDGDLVKAWDPVLTITGPYHLFAHLESVYLGVLARQTKIATNTWRVTTAANGKPVLFFADRFDHYATQGGDGYAAKVGGATGWATNAQSSWWGSEGTGTMPHALIAAFGGDVVAACNAFREEFPEIPLAALVDFNNDCVGDSVRCVKRFGRALSAVRLDTGAMMVDKSMTEEDMGEESVTGVNPRLVTKVRAALDAHGGQHVKIIVSGGFSAERISRFERAGIPVDTYAVGSGLLKGSMDYTADVVAPTAKTGRWQRNAEALEKVE